jgi:hypothetical protein
MLHAICSPTLPKPPITTGIAMVSPYLQSCPARD